MRSLSILAPFASQNINLVKIESPPSGRKMGEYAFYIEIDGNVLQERVKAALDFLKNSVGVYSLGIVNRTTLVEIKKSEGQLSPCVHNQLVFA